MKKIVVSALCVVLLIGSLGGCGGRNPLDPKNPVTLTMWHNFGGILQQSMDVLIDEFNATVGRDQGVIVNVEAIASSAELQEALNMIINGDPGAPQMPDITTAYPRTAVQFQAKGLLANLDEYFSEAELAAYIPAFVEEGRFGDGGLYVFPFAKSTEVLFVDRTLFDRFAADTGALIQDLTSFEGITAMGINYYQWTDAQTPDTADDGKQFFAADSWINLAQAGMLQQGGSLFEGENFALDNSAYRHIFEIFYSPSLIGGVAVYDGYSSDLHKTGDVICSVGSSAGVTAYGDRVTYPDNTSEPVEFTILPYPVFEGGENFAIQRGNGLMAAKTDGTKEYAAALFIKWFTAAERNLRFVGETGYMPVTAEAFELMTPQWMDTVQDQKVRQLLNAVAEMRRDYEFFVAPAFETFDSLSRAYEQEYKAFIPAKREEYLAARFIDGSAALAEFKERLVR